MSKLHIPGAGAQLTSCGRQLNNHRADRAQDAKGASLSSTLTEYLDALAKGKACRHCGRASNILPPITRAIADGEGDESNWGDSE